MTGPAEPIQKADGTITFMNTFKGLPEKVSIAGGPTLSRADGSHLHQLTPFSYQVGVKEDWSPDSGHIMFISQAGGTVNTDTIRPDGTGLFLVTHYPAGGLSAFGNSYSPDGRWIVLRLENEGLYALYKIHPGLAAPH